MRKLLIAAAVSGLVAAPAFAASKTVRVGDNWFIDSNGGTVTVNKGTKVIWKNVGGSPHDVKVKKGPARFSSSTLFKGDTFAKRMRKRGTYRIICTIHGGDDQSMRLVVK